MADKPKADEPTETMFQRFAMLARKGVTAPKPKDEPKGKSNKS